MEKPSYVSTRRQCDRCQATGAPYQRSTLRCPNQARIEPFCTWSSCPSANFSMSPSVHVGWCGIVSSMSVTLAACRSEWRRSEPSLETTNTAPNPNVLLAGCFCSSALIDDGDEFAVAAVHCRRM